MGESKVPICPECGLWHDGVVLKDCPLPIREKRRAAAMAYRPIQRARRGIRRPTHRDGGCFVNTDACVIDGLAGIAYESAVLGKAHKVVSAAGSTEGELRALLFAMEAAENQGLNVVTFRCDCYSTARPHSIKAPALTGISEVIAALIARHERWNVQHVHRRSNVLAHGAARRALREVGLR